MAVIKELEKDHPQLFRGLIRQVEDFWLRSKVLELSKEDADNWARQHGYFDLQGLKTSVEYYKGRALGYAMAAWTTLHGAPPKDVMEEVEISEALKKITSYFEDSHEPKKEG